MSIAPQTENFDLEASADRISRLCVRDVSSLSGLFTYKRDWYYNQNEIDCDIGNCVSD